MVLADAGPTLPQVVVDRARAEAEVLRAFDQAGRARALLHQSGLVHGRPAVRDICWDGQEARFIDLERFCPARHSRFWQAADVVMLVQTAFTQWPCDGRWIDAALAGYAAHALKGAMHPAWRGWHEGWHRSDGWPSALARLQRKSRELPAVRLTLTRHKRGVPRAGDHKVGGRPSDL